MTERTFTGQLAAEQDAWDRANEDGMLCYQMACGEYYFPRYRNGVPSPGFPQIEDYLPRGNRPQF